MKKVESMVIGETKDLLEVLSSLTKLPQELRGKTLATLLARYTAECNEIARLEKAHAEALASRDDIGNTMSDLAVRIRAAVKGIYGLDSHEYERVGGTRKSDRKRPLRKQAPVAAPSPTAASQTTPDAA
jgi:hypothetical protein